MKSRMIMMWAAILMFSAVFAQTENKRKAEFNLENGLAIQGYDPVSYFSQQKAVKGKPGIAASYQGATYYFSSEANKEAFRKNPAGYEPQYGGWCAYAMGDYGKKVEINPETFKIINGKLYLFYNAYLNNTLKTWNKNEVVLKKQADANWGKFIGKP
ncbi:YHS domain-containing protein [Flavobacterium sp. MAH-1]|uniref:YHS domain-containing protein n=1 Tax=Flavobacterium agri TaxID=2743471 RepID=A0A7Y8Y1M8_9FLAO|nr:YHS domain-containing (seleno)protein [Flavobacterium agri]NUY80738.1 YHS domain-containing protein [Flavobacterium agri]NYA70762.1 YHS domain-containing protein [Flavobacterium agri]